MPISGWNVINSTFTNNSGNLYLYDIINSIIFDSYDNYGTVSNSAIRYWNGGGEGNISLAGENDGYDPNANYVRFVDPENGDFRLGCGSACINMGTPDVSVLGLPSFDLQGNPRVMDGRIDMGAYEFDPETECPEIITQTIPLVPGWNWYSSFIELNGIDGLAMLEESLGANCAQISSQTAFTKYYPQGWYGSLTTMVNEQMYRLKMTNPATVNMVGSVADPAEHPITLSTGWSHIGYISASAMSVEEALSGLDATVGDLIKTQTAYTKFYGAENGWFGSLSTIQPGDGLMYKSGNTESVTLIYPQASRGETKANLTAENNHWVPDMREYPTNMTVMAVVELDGEEITTDNYELAVFANGECRGSVNLLYVEPIDRHVAFMTITGEDEDNLSFALYDKITGIENFNTENRVVFHTDDMLGDFDNPYVVRFGNVESGDVKIYPNPVKAGETINVIVPEKAVLEIVNTLGEVVGTQTLSEGDNIVKTPATPGVYMLRIISNGNDVKCQRIVLQ